MALASSVGGCARTLGLDDLTFHRSVDADVAGPECNSQADCTDASLGPAFCRDSHCVELTNYDVLEKDAEQRGDCKVVVGRENLQRGGEPFVFGAFADIDPVLPESSVAVLNYALALEEFSSLGGIQIAGRSRLPVVVVCNAAVSEERIERSLDHLVGRLKVPAVIAAISDVNSLKRSFEHVRQGPGSVFFLSPFSSSSVLTAIRDDDLLWHLLPDIVDVAAAYLPLVTRVENYLERADDGPAAAELRLALLVASDDTKLSQVGEVLHQGLRFNGRSATENAPDSYLKLNVTSVHTDPDADLSEQVARLRAFLPHIVVSAAGPELSTKIMPQLEQGWPDSKQPRPFYILSPSQLVDRDGLLRVVRLDAAHELERRIAGVNIAAAADPTLYMAYLDRLESKFPRSVNLESSENFYDAAYFLLYAAAAGATTAAPSGIDTARGMRRLLRGVPYQVGPTDLVSALGYLSDAPRRSIALQGTLGPPDFDDAGARLGTGSVWCIEKLIDARSNASSWQFHFDTLRYEPSAGTLEGSFACLTGF